MIKKKTTAILYFSRSAQAEVEHKKWNSLQSKRQNIAVAEHLISSTLTILEKTGLPVFQYDEEIQVGATFGYRLANAFQDLYSKGFDSIVTVGNDCIDIADISWENIETEVSEGVAVLGPSLRKGAYLIGMHKEQFDFEKFAQLSWHTNKLQKELIQYLTQLSRLPVVLLDVKVDLNSKNDIVRLLNSLFLGKVSLLLQNILVLLGFVRSLASGECSFVLDRLQISTSRQRGPPSLYS